MDSGFSYRCWRVSRLFKIKLKLGRERVGVREIENLLIVEEEASTHTQNHLRRVKKKICESLWSQLFMRRALRRFFE